MKKTNFTNFQPFRCLGTNWLREIIPLLALFVFVLPMNLQAQGTQAPNCSNFSPAIDAEGKATVSAGDFLTNADHAASPLTVTVTDNRFSNNGIVIETFTFTWDEVAKEWNTEKWDVCKYLGRDFEFSASNGAGSCSRGFINVNGTPPLVINSALSSDLDLPHIGDGKMVVYCGNVPSPEDVNYIPSVTMPCGGSYTGPTAMPDWRDVNACGDSDTAEVILRHWEAVGRDGQRNTITDTIIVMRLPKLTIGSFVGSPKDSFYCELHPYKEKGDDVYQYAAWKQPMGIADFEQPYSQMGALSYHIPGYVIEAGLINACAQSQSKYDSYLDYVIMKNPDGTVVRIKDIISGDYMAGVLARATTTQLGYGILNQIYEGATGLIDAITIGGWSSCNVSGIYTFYNYLFPVIGSEVLSENGTYETVTEEWFYNGTGNSPYWFSGGWPSIYGDGDCMSYCSGADVTELDAGVYVKVPSLNVDGFGSALPSPYSPESCDTIRITSSMSCGLTMERESDDWVDYQSCVQERGGKTTIVQTCWADLDFELPCIDPDASSGDTCLVLDYQDKEVCCGRVIITLNQIQQLIDTIPPIFDFCYPEKWEGVEEAILAGKQHQKAKDFERNSPTVYTTSTHECGASIYVPSIQVSDNCTGVESVKAVFHHLDGGVKKVALELTDTTFVDIGGGAVCTLYTYSHTSDPIYIPFQGCNGEAIEVVYSATDGCNESTWSKFVKVRDDIPPTVVTNHDVNVTMHSAVEYVTTVSYDQGSWDNCAIELMLARRTDWASNTSIIDLCSDAPENLDSWAKILSEVGFSDVTQITTAVNGGVVGSPDIDINKLDKYLSDGEIEEYYLAQIKYLWTNGNCSEKVVHAWLFDIARALGECSDADLSNTTLEQIFDNLFAEAGYGNHLAYIGGGWAEMVPFICEDACEEVPSELLVIDYCCNVGIGGTETYVKDNTQPRVAKTLPNLTVSCEAYNLFFKDIVTAAAAYSGSDVDTSGAFAALNEVFGGYVVANVDNQGRPVATDGTLLPDSVVNFEFGNISCREEGEGSNKNVVLDTITQTAANGIIATTCSGSYTQTVTVKMDECGLGTITRRFWVTNGCNGTTPKNEIQSQTIVIETACPMRESMFEVPENLGSVYNPVCLPREISNNNLLDTIGELSLKDHLVGKLCNQIAIGHDVEVQKLVDYPDYVQYKITWKAIDWCCAEALPEREYEFIQKVIARIDPECTLDEGGDDNGDISLVQGVIATEDGDAVANVEMKAVLGSGSPLTTVTSGDGAYNFSIQDGSNVSLVPSKNTGFSNGVTTFDLVLIQRHVLQKEMLDSKYKRIAADVNGDGAVNAFDVFELRQLVMNPTGQLANNTSWRFFDKNTDKEVFEVSNLKGDMNVDWVGVKIGDVDLSGDASRSSSRAVVKGGELTLNIADKQLKAGETYRVAVTSENFAEVMGMQYTLAYVENQVEVESIEAGALNISENNYYRFAPGVITTSWSEAEGQSLASDAVLFTIVLKAKSAVQLRDALSLNSRVTPVEAYGADGLKDVSLRFDGGADNGFALYQNTPNPYAGQTVIGFNLPEASKATLSVYDVTGKMLKVVEGEYGQGYNEVKLKGADLKVLGVLYYQLDTKTYTATKKMVVID